MDRYGTDHFSNRHNGLSSDLDGDSDAALGVGEAVAEAGQLSRVHVLIQLILTSSIQFNLVVFTVLQIRQGFLQLSTYRCLCTLQKQRAFIIAQLYTDNQKIQFQFQNIYCEINTLFTDMLGYLLSRMFIYLHFSDYKICC